MKLTEQETTELERIVDEIISKGGATKGQIKVNSDPALVARYNELSAKLEVTSEPEPEQKPKVAEKPLTPVQARKNLLEARLKNAGKYSLAQRQSWRKELNMIEAGTWRRPIPPRVHKGIYEEVVGG